jgi:hypothetical protein
MSCNLTCVVKKQTKQNKKQPHCRCWSGKRLQEAKCRAQGAGGTLSVSVTHVRGTVAQAGGWGPGAENSLDSQILKSRGMREGLKW